MAAKEECPSPKPSYTPQEVAATFVEGYYLLLRDRPEELHKFYMDSSTVSRRMGSDGAMASFTTMEEIKKQVDASMECKGYEIVSSCAQFASPNEGVFVVVAGFLTDRDDKTRKFHQSFLLAPMEGVDSYFVSNDILIFLDEQETEKVVPKKGLLEEKETVEVPLPKKSFLSVVSALSENNDPFKAPPPVKRPVRAAPQEKKPVRAAAKTRKTVVDVVKEEASVFVGNVAFDTKPEELYEAFKSNFGAIRENGVQIRTDKLNRCYAFIRFESSDSAKIAIQASSIRIGNRKLNIEEKKRNASNNHKLSQDQSINGNANGQKMQ